jgi:hypothetical protein
MMEAKSSPADQPLAGAAAAAANKQSIGTDPRGRQYLRQEQQAETAQCILEGGCEKGNVSACSACQLHFASVVNRSTRTIS